MKIDVSNKSKVSAHIKLEQNTFRILNFKKLICMHLSPENVTETKEAQSIEMSIRQLICLISLKEALLSNEKPARKV